MLRFLSRTSAVLAVAASAFRASAEDWPQWRGPRGDGQVPESYRLVTKLPTEAKVIWKMTVGEGLAAPIVAEGKVFYFDAVEKKETLHAISADTTQELWRATIDDTFADNQGPAGPRNTPLVDGDRVYAVSCKGELQCLRVKDGSQVWRVNYTNDFEAVFIGEKGKIPGAARHGNNGSPLIVGDRLYACPGGTNGAGVVCFDKFTGKVIWKSQNDQAGFAPPRLASPDHLVCFTVEGLLGLRASDGKFLYRIPVKTDYSRHVTTPVFFENYIVVSSHQAGTIGVKTTASADGIGAELAWTSKDAAMNFSSPVAVGKYLYGLGPAKDFICVEIPTGKIMWSKEGYLATGADKAYAAFMVMGNNILSLTDGGLLVLFAADPEAFKEVGQLQVCGMNWCNPAYADGRIYVRDGVKKTGPGEMTCVELVGK